MNILFSERRKIAPELIVPNVHLTEGLPHDIDNKNDIHFDEMEALRKRHLQLKVRKMELEILKLERELGVGPSTSTS